MIRKIVSEEEKKTLRGVGIIIIHFFLRMRLSKHSRRLYRSNNDNKHYKRISVNSGIKSRQRSLNRKFICERMSRVIIPYYPTSVIEDQG